VARALSGKADAGFPLESAKKELGRYRIMPGFPQR
jgi:hypothetical protein